jgi:antitoxin VapB
MGMNIKNPETQRLARELARQTGESITTAITIAIKERLERKKTTSERESRLEWLNRITARTAKIMNDGRSSQELVEELYDPETGLPR